MKAVKRLSVWVVVAVLAIGMAAPAVQAKTYKMTVVAGHPPIFLWVTLARDFMLPEINKRLEAAGKGDKVVWKEAYGGTVAKIGGCLEAIEEGIADMGFVGTIFEAAKMPLHNVTYFTPFGTEDIYTVVDVIGKLQSQIPALGKEWTKHNQVYLGGAGLDTYGIITNFPVTGVADVKGHKIAAPGPSANWLKNTGGVAVAANLNTYYEGIKTGVFDGTLTFMTAAAAIKVYQVAPNICMVNFGSQFAGGISVNQDIFDTFPEYMQQIFVEVGQEYTARLAKAQADKAAAAMAAMESAGAKVVMLDAAGQKAWADTLPNIPMEWAKDNKNRQAMVKGYLDGLRAAGVTLVRDWDE